MTVYDVPNIENVIVTPVGNPAIMYRLTANAGWWLHLIDPDAEGAPLYKRSMALSANRDWSDLQVVAEADLPPDAETADAPKDEPEVM